MGGCGWCGLLKIVLSGAVRRCSVGSRFRGPWTPPRFDSSRSSLPPQGASINLCILLGARRRRPTSPCKPASLAHGEADFDLGHVDDMREALGGGGDGGMMGADADLRLIPDNDDVDFPELAALCLSEPPVPAPFDTVGSAAQEVRRVCKYSSCRSMGVGLCGVWRRAQCALCFTC